MTKRMVVVTCFAFLLLMCGPARAHDISHATEIVVVLDSSGSMESVKMDTIGAFNQFLSDQQNVKGALDCNLSLLLFNTDVARLYDGTDITDVPRLGEDIYKPQGNTALLDAVGHAINDLDQRMADKFCGHERADDVVFVVLTDGLENSSTEFSKDTLRTMISEQEERYGWHFVFLAADQDAFQDAFSTGFTDATTTIFIDTDVSGTITNTLDATSGNITDWRMTGDSTTLTFTDAQREQADPDDEDKDTP